MLIATPLEKGSWPNMVGLERKGSDAGAAISILADCCVLRLMVSEEAGLLPNDNDRLKSRRPLEGTLELVGAFGVLGALGAGAAE